MIACATSYQKCGLEISISFDCSVVKTKFFSNYDNSVVISFNSKTGPALTCGLCCASSYHNTNSLVTEKLRGSKSALIQEMACR